MFYRHRASGKFRALHWDRKDDRLPQQGIDRDFADRPRRNGPTLRHRSASSKPASAKSGQGAMVASNIVRPETKNRRAGIWEPNPLPSRVGAQEDGRL